MEEQIIKKYEGEDLKINIIDEIPWFCFRDICMIIGLTKESKKGKVFIETNKLIQKIPNEYVRKDQKILNARGELRNTFFLTKRGVEILINQNKTEKTNDFKFWLHTNFSFPQKNDEEDNGVLIIDI